MSIFTAYDIRGIYGESLTESVYEELGFVLAQHAKRIVIGHDGRAHSPSLVDAFVRGLSSHFLQIHLLGEVPTPVVGFARQYFNADLGIMITASHNPPRYNGMKVMDAKGSVSGSILKSWCESPLPPPRKGTLNISFHDVRAIYREHLVASCSMLKYRRKIVWDLGFGALRQIAPFSIPSSWEQLILRGDRDAPFLEQPLDPSREEHLDLLKVHVIQKKADLGIAFDADGDRLGVIDHQGRHLKPDQLVLLWAEPLLKKHPGAKIVLDVKCSEHAVMGLRALGGKPIRCRTGHAFVREKMREENAVLGVERSGHVFFRDNFGLDDGLYAALQLLSHDLSLFYDNLPTTYGDDIRIPCDNPKVVLQRIHTQLLREGRSVDTLDGLRVVHPQGWWLIRASQTEPLLNGRWEAWFPGSEVNDDWRTFVEKNL